MPAVNIMLVSYGNREVVKGVSREMEGEGWLMGGGIKLRVYKEVSIMVWYFQ